MDVATRAARAAGRPDVEVVAGDASLADQYAELALVCGLLGNISDADVERVLDHRTALCRAGGTLVRTRSRDITPDLVPQVCAWLEERGFERLWVSDPSIPQSVGAHRFTGEPRQLPIGTRMFDFIGYDVLRRG